MPISPEENLRKIAEDYFDYMAENFPVMCLSDEFYYFPRVKRALRYLNFLDSFDEDKLRGSVSYIKKLKSSLERLDSKDTALETLIDLRVLKQSMSIFLIEFDQIKIWQIDPALYLKVLLLGVTQLVNRFSFIKKDTEGEIRDRISQIPRLLYEAKCNLKKVPSAYLEVAKQMTEGALDYFKESSAPIKDKKTLEALEDFKTFLIERPSHTVFIKEQDIIKGILKESFSCNRSIEEIFEIAFREYQQTLKELCRIAEEVKPGKSWQEILSGHRIDAKDEEELLALYSGQIKKIENFIGQKDIITLHKTQDIRVRLTPPFMRPIRASASYSSPVTDDSREPGYFYVTADFAKNKKSGKNRIISNVHNEYIFVTAHEACPGHHLLDSIRRRIDNPVRQQIESPFFYEGWASYAERLIDELGYIKDPIQRMLGLKRQAWRAVRAMLDVGIRIDKLKFKQAEELLTNLGYERRIARFMFRQYILSPGYQLCYTIGKFEIDRLKEKFSSELGLKRFHDLLLQGGQIPFDLIEERLSRLTRQ